MKSNASASAMTDSKALDQFAVMPTVFVDKKNYTDADLKDLDKTGKIRALFGYDLKTDTFSSDHNWITHPNSTVIGWNMLKLCKAVVDKRDLVLSTSIPKQGDISQFITRSGYICVKTNEIEKLFFVKLVEDKKENEKKPVKKIDKIEEINLDSKKFKEFLDVMKPTAEIKTLKRKDLLKFSAITKPVHDAYKIIGFNNGFRVEEETTEQYQARFKKQLHAICQEVRKQNATREVLISTIALCEVAVPSQGGISMEDMEAIFKQYGFTCIAGQVKRKPKYLTQAYGDGEEDLLVMAYDPALVQFKKAEQLADGLGFNSVVSNTEWEENWRRFHTVRFTDKKTGQDFVIVNTHQNWNLANQNPDQKKNNIEPIGLRDCERILNHFKNVAVNFTGDFNVTEFPLPKEHGMLIQGLNSNLAYLNDGTYKVDSCDHLMMNQQWMEVFSPAYLKKRSEEISDSFFSNTFSNNSLFSAKPATVSSSSSTSATATMVMDTVDSTASASSPVKKQRTK